MMTLADIDEALLTAMILTMLAMLAMLVHHAWVRR